jgi:hypothetical protein
VPFPAILAARTGSPGQSPAKTCRKPGLASPPIRGFSPFRDIGTRLALCCKHLYTYSKRWKEQGAIGCKALLLSSFGTTNTKPKYRKHRQKPAFCNTQYCRGSHADNGNQFPKSSVGNTLRRRPDCATATRKREGVAQSKALHNSPPTPDRHIASMKTTTNRDSSSAPPKGGTPARATHRQAPKVPSLTRPRTALTRSQPVSM